ncbi:conserved protein, unknown function [Plasmodium yoelii]|uniref:THH1/TOM1/TOM3 domain-containing protein n=1 Tax=Plasmodium yoelii TaxID=5861 RepID=A0A077Y439_PLAYE|nr:conserved protein, unknown function [Plasmodium yoelii]CDU17489.1 conserved Plasmodium protein, unknown function [Plasmodium yoelii]VTZ77254.1 conserved protein, unknown function [Plasmodium yoelii]|eukprot:XP_022811927.1 conserved protein, unknown function [Plasmodium yoelii]
MSTGVYLLILLVYVYAFLSYRIYKLIIRNKSISSIPSSNLTGEKTRYFLFCFLFFCHITRILSTTILTYLDIRDDAIDYNTLLLFPNFYFLLILLKTIPTYFFLSSFTIIILFWSQVYYSSMLVTSQHLKSYYIYINFSGYIINLLFAIIEYLLSSFKNYIYFNFIFESLVDYSIAISFLYYGVKVTSKLKEKNKGISQKSRITQRILSLAIVMFVILSLKGLYSFWCFTNDGELYKAQYDVPTYDALIYFISECIPSIFIIYTFQSNKDKNPMSFEYATPLCSQVFDPYDYKMKKKANKPLIKKT